MKMYSITTYLFLFLWICSNLACQKRDYFSEDKNLSYDDTVVFGINGIDFDYLATIQNVRNVIPINKWLFSNVISLTEIGEQVNKSLTGSQDDISGLFHTTYQLLGAGAGGFGPPLQGASQGINIKAETEMQAIINHLDVHIINENDWVLLPFLLRKEVVEFIYRTRDINLILKQFSIPLMKHLSSDLHSNSRYLYEALFRPWERRELLDFESIDVLEKIDLKKLSFATRVLSDQLNGFRRLEDVPINPKFKGCKIETQLGEIIINGVQNDRIEGDYLLVLELGGNDTYIGNNAHSYGAAHPLGIVVDFQGDDQYSSENGFLASAIMGISVLIDLDGNDHYQTRNPGLAFSLYGSSILYDLRGSDVYEGLSDYSQASAYAGAAILIDRSGNDIYKSQSYSQAFAGTLGAAVLLDVTGDEHYNINGNIISELNDSFVQGAARGRWAEATDGQSLGGGIGIFVDNSGDDHYGAQSFSQGASYYFGLGVFVDQEGNDDYNAVSHSQGYAAHYSLASFCDHAGNDSYNAKTDSLAITQIIGSGRDYSTGVFSDYAGDDLYFFGNRSAGIGDLEGIGIFIDYLGNDSYRWLKNDINSGVPSAGQTIQIKKGMSTGTRLISPAVNYSKGIFLDSNGDRIK